MANKRGNVLRLLIATAMLALALGLTPNVAADGEAIEAKLTIQDNSPDKFILNAGKKAGLTVGHYYQVELDGEAVAVIRVSTVTFVNSRGQIFARVPDMELATGDYSLFEIDKSEAERFKKQHQPTYEPPVAIKLEPTAVEDVKAKGKAVQKPAPEPEPAVAEEPEEEEPEVGKVTRRKTETPEEEEIEISKVQRSQKEKKKTEKEIFEPTRYSFGLGYYMMSESNFDSALMWSLRAKNVKTPWSQVGPIDITLNRMSPDYQNTNNALLPGESVDFQMWQILFDRCFRGCDEPLTRGAYRIYAGPALAFPDQETRLLTGSVSDSATQLGLSLRLGLTISQRLDADFNYQYYGSGGNDVNIGGSALTLQYNF